MRGLIRASAINSQALVVPRERQLAGRAELSRLFRSLPGRVGLVILCGLLAGAALGGRIASPDPFASVGRALSPPTLAYPMGTDDLGRDLLSAVASGTRTSLLVAFTVTMLAGLIGIPLGTMAAWRGRLVDDGLMRITEFVQVVPRFFLAVIVIALFGPGLDRLILLLGLTSWPTIARVVRAEVLSL